jgi:hypothetical protein
MLFALAVSVACTPPAAVSVSTCEESLDQLDWQGATHRVCDLALAQTHVTLDVRRSEDSATQTLAIAHDGSITWQTSATFAHGSGEQIKQIVGVVGPSGENRVLYSLLHCPSQCLTADLVALSASDGSEPVEIYRSSQFGVGARLSAATDGSLNVMQPVFQPGDMCCPSGSSTTHLTWNGVTYVPGD